MQRAYRGVIENTHLGVNSENTLGVNAKITHSGINAENTLVQRIHPGLIQTIHTQEL